MLLLLERSTKFRDSFHNILRGCLLLVEGACYLTKLNIRFDFPFITVSSNKFLSGKALVVALTARQFLRNCEYVLLMSKFGNSTV